MRRSRRLKFSAERKTGGRPLQAAQPQFGPFNDYLPARFRTKMKYVASFTAATSASPAQVIFTANSVYDPGNSSDTHHAVGYTQLAALYSRFRVLASDIHVKADMEATSSGIGATQVGASIVVWPSTSSTVAGSYVNATAQTGARNVEFNGTTRATIGHRFSVQELLGMRLIEGSDDLSAVIGNQPSRKVYWNALWVSSVAQTGVNLNVTCTVTFDVEWSERYDLALPTMNKLQSLLDEDKELRQEQQRFVMLRAAATMLTKSRGDGIPAKPVPSSERKSDTAFTPLDPIVSDSTGRRWTLVSSRNAVAPLITEQGDHGSTDPGLRPVELKRK